MKKTTVNIKTISSAELNKMAAKKGKEGQKAMKEITHREKCVAKQRAKV